MTPGARLAAAINVLEEFERAPAPAQPRHGGNGAFYVLLRRRRD